MTPQELAKVSNAARALGFTNAEVDACNGDQMALLTLLASVRSEVSANGKAVAYGARKQNNRTIKDIEDYIAKRVR